MTINPPISLERLIHKNFFVSALIPLFVVELLLLVLYFAANAYVSGENQRTLAETTTDNVRQTLAREAQNIDLQLKEVSRLATIMQREHEQFFETLPTCKGTVNGEKFGVHANGAFHKLTNDGGASLYYAPSTQIGPSELRKAFCSKKLDLLLKSIVDASPIVTQAYLNTFDNMNRLYPFMPDAPEQYGPNLVMQDHNFYYLADAQHDPQRNVVWTDAYLDPAGQGWMTSAVVPIYHDNRLEGVSGLDVTIDVFVRTVLDLKLPWPASKLLLDKSGMIMSMSEEAETLLGLKELKDHTYTTAIATTVAKPVEFNLHNLKNSQLREQLGAIIDGKQISGTSTVTIDDHRYLLRYDTIAETGWRLMTVVDEESILAPIHKLKTLSIRIGLTAIGILILFYALFFLYLLFKSRALASRIARPIQFLSRMTSDVGTSTPIQTQDSIGILEIDTLSGNFNTMIQTLSERSEQLVQSRVREELRLKERDMLTRLATSDALTGLANRRKAEELMLSEAHRAERHHETFGLILLDIDFFKNVNDTHGHAAGDEVLREFARLLLDTVRNTDVVTRWGGEEFVVICINVQAQELRLICEKIRMRIAAHVFPTGGRVTVSSGASLYVAGDTPDDVMVRADQALYDAKNEGRNCCRYRFKP